MAMTKNLDSKKLKLIKAIMSIGEENPLSARLQILLRVGGR